VIASHDSTFMQAALRLARLSAPHPNPPVGALVVLDGRIVGMGHHERAGAAHAEVVALTAARGLTNGAELYVSLEPCNHFGRTAPCVDAILSAGIRRVVVGCLDPNPGVCGGGSSRLALHGVQVAFGPWRAQAEALIAEWKGSLRPS
jgi:diaminohydroxyphosphoribosylaminopyrimidine deaminase/5-amino-6-(5-phosphoribosylamino)uracil reductase